MPITVDQTSLIRSSAGSKIRVTGKFSFTTYTTGGDAVTAETVGLSRLEYVNIEEKSGYDFAPVINTAQSQMDVQAFASGSGTFAGSPLAGHSHDLQVTQDEAVIVNPATGVSAALANIPLGSADIVYIVAGGVTGAATKVPVGAVANSKEVSINYATGVLQFLAADSVQNASVTYTRAATSSVSAGTPSGTISGTAGGEVANGADLSPVGPISFEIIGL